MRKPDITKLTNLANQMSDVVSDLTPLVDYLESVANEHGKMYNGHSDKWKDGDSGKAAKEIVDSLDKAYGDAATAMGSMLDAALEIRQLLDLQS